MAMLRCRWSALVATLILIAIAAMSPSVARAGKPTSCPVGTCINGPVSYPAGLVCPFPVRVEPLNDSTVVHALPDGDVFITGRLVQRATNLRTGESIDFPRSGPLRLVFNQDGTVTDISLGQLLWTFFAQDVGGPGLFLFKGRVVIQSTPDGSAASVSRVPNKIDVCRLLA
jgi:hypothetical protein